MKSIFSGHRRLLLRTRAVPPTSENNEANPAIEENDEATTTEGETPTVQARRSNVPKREKFDSGISEDIDNGKGLTSSSSEEDNTINLLVSDEDTMEIDSDSDYVETLSKVNDSTDTNQTNASDTCIPNKQNSKVENTYEFLMRAKIQALPLPPTIKAYLNFYREF